IIADYAAYEFEDTYDIVISSLSIHHLTHTAKQQLFATIYKLLPSGGSFINADQAQAHNASADAYYRKRWLEQIRASGLSQEAINASIERRRVDINAKLHDQISWMEQAGFEEVDCMYKNLDFAVFYAKKLSS
ncbi:methyltransferase domain-containing protein, partial [Clostridium perfringens]|nr:methyltransferase domain-containing protein [Clostridium perfringens]